MARKRNPADAVVEYFESAPLAEVAAVLAVCWGIVKRRQPEKAPRAPRTRATPAPAGTSTTDAGAPGAGTGREGDGK